jgi:hypothetical protein
MAPPMRARGELARPPPQPLRGEVAPLQHSVDLAACKGRRRSGEREREGAHAHDLEPVEECAPAAGTVVGYSTLVFVSRPGARTLAMDPTEEVDVVGEEERRGNGAGGGGGAGGAPWRCT